jgi:hypothetical protein
MARCIGVDLWHYDDGGKSLKRATDFLATYRGRIEAWPHPELRPDAGELEELLRRARRAWPDAGFPANDQAEIKRFFGVGPALGEGKETKSN